MKRKFLSLLLITTLLFFLNTTVATASEKIAGISAMAIKPDILVATTDKRPEILKAFLEENGSPMAGSAQTFVKAADENGLDWKLVAAISGLESGFGNAIPSGSYNAWGWGVYGDHVIYFKSFDDGIITVSKGLRERYINPLGTDNVYAIGRLYAASPTWADRVTMFMNRIDIFAKQYESAHQINTLSLSL